jgi:hypothetical protein
MSASPSNNSDDKPTPPDKSTVILLLGIAGDTTWRMFVPVLSLLAGGIWLDRTLGTKPIMTIVGLMIGVGVAGLLIRQQIKRNPKK